MSYSDELTEEVDGLLSGYVFPEKIPKEERQEVTGTIATLTEPPHLGDEGMAQVMREIKTAPTRSSLKTIETGQRKLAGEVSAAREAEAAMKESESLGGQIRTKGLAQGLHDWQVGKPNPPEPTLVPMMPAPAAPPQLPPVIPVAKSQTPIAPQSQTKRSTESFSPASSTPSMPQIGTRTRTKLSPDDEEYFREWYAEDAKRYGLSPDPDDPAHRYDYRGAWKQGYERDETDHLPSQFKDDDHPNLIVGGVNTKTGQPVQAVQPPTPQGQTSVERAAGILPLPTEKDRLRLQGFTDQPSYKRRGYTVTPKQPLSLGQAFEQAGNAYMQGVAQVPEGALKSVGIMARQLDEWLDKEKGKQTEEYLTYQLGEKIKQFAQQTFPTRPDLQRNFLLNTVPQAAGSMTAFLGAGVVGAVAKAPITATAVAGAVTLAPTMYEEAKQKGATEGTARGAFSLGLALGATEALPIANLLNRLAPGTQTTLKEAIKQGSIQGIEEALQEGVQQVGQNAVAKWLYDANRQLYEQVVEGAGAGGIVGFLVGFLAAGGRRGHVVAPGGPAAPTPTAPVPEPPEQPPAPVSPAPTAVGPVPRPTPTTTQIPITPTIVERPRPMIVTPTEIEQTTRAGETEVPAGLTQEELAQKYPEAVQEPLAVEQPAPQARPSPITVTPTEVPAPIARPEPRVTITETAITPTQAGLVGQEIGKTEYPVAERPTEKPAPVTYQGFQPGAGTVPGTDLWNLTEDLPDHPKGSTLSTKTIEDMGYTVPEKPAATVDQAAQQTDTAPTEAQKNEGNYRKGHVTIAGMDISIENPEGSIRSGTDASGETWSITMKDHYGYILGTKGKDKEHIDVFIKPGTEDDYDGTVWVVDQVNPDTGAFDEHKVILGARSAPEAERLYLQNYAPGWQGMGDISGMDMGEFKDWLKEGNTKKPFAAHEDTPGLDAIRVSDDVKKRRERVRVPASQPEAKPEVIPGLKEVAVSPGIAANQQVQTLLDRLKADVAAITAGRTGSLTNSQLLLRQADALPAAADADIKKEIRQLAKTLSGLLKTAESVPLTPTEAQAVQDVEKIKEGAAKAGETALVPTGGPQAPSTVTYSGRAAPYFVDLGGKRYPVDSLEEASRKWDQVRQATQAGSNAPTPRILDSQMNPIGYISYNGRIWSGTPEDWTQETPLLYDNREPQPAQVTGPTEGGTITPTEVPHVPSRPTGLEDVRRPQGEPTAPVSGVGDLRPPGAVPSEEGSAGPRPTRQPHGPRRVPAVGGGRGPARPDVPAPGSAPAPVEASRPEPVAVEAGPGTGHDSAAGPKSGKAGHDWLILPGDDFIPRGAKTKYRANLAAIRLLKQIEGEGRLASPDEQAVLVQYTGWGGLPQAFDRYRRGEWEREAEELEDALTPEEYQAARASTPNAHYTDPVTIRGIYVGLQRLGFKGGRILEPAMGVGHFFGAMPAELAGHTAKTGIELDSLSGRIAKQLYQSGNIFIAPFEETVLPDNFFDVAIGNVPFADVQVFDPHNKDLSRQRFTLHNYFFAKALTKLRPGGVLAFITSRYTMDAGNGKVRDYLAKQANLLGAIRLPNTQFKAIANTEVVTDILFLQKRAPNTEATGPAWAKLGNLPMGKGEPAAVNEYFVAHPEMILGKPSLAGTMYRDQEFTVEADGRNMEEALATAMEALPEGRYTKRNAPPASTTTVAVLEALPAPDELREGNLTVEKGHVYVKRGLELVPREGIPREAIQRIEGMAKVRGAVRATLSAQMEGADDATIATTRKELNSTYDRFVKRHGPISSRPNLQAMAADPDYPLLQALEKYDKKTKTATKADIFTKRVLEHRPRPETAETAKEAMLISLSETNRLDWPRMSALTGKTPEMLQEELAGIIFKNPEGDWEPADAYLSGNVRAKLKAAEAAAALDPAFAANVEALKQVQPVDLLPSQIDVKLGVGWIPTTDYEDFIKHLFGIQAYHRGVSVHYNAAMAAYSISIPVQYDNVENTKTWGTARYYGTEILEDSMASKIPTVRDRLDDGTTIVNEKETLAARQKQEAMQAEFARWVWEDQARAERLSAQYNQEFNNTQKRQFDGSHLTLPGMTPLIKLRPHQKDAIWRALQSGNTLLAHVVGSGKTFTMVGIAMESRRLGIAKKPLFVVPNHLAESGYWRDAIRKMYPAAKILAPSKEDFSAKNRKALAARMATGDWDAIILANSQYTRLPISRETFIAFLNEQIRILEDFIVEAKSMGSKKANKNIVKELEKAKKRLATKLKKKQDETPSDDAVTFEETGVDMLLVDEAQNFKNLWFPTRMTRVSGLPNSESQRAFDMYLKTQYVQNLGNGRNVIFATGTPISNTMAEAFTVSRYLQPKALEAAGLEHFDAWARQYGNTVNAWELAPDGSGYRVRTRFAEFINVPELTQMLGQTMDIKSQEDLQLPVPDMKTGKPIIVTADPGPALKAYVASLIARAKRLKTAKVDPREDNMLKITGDGRHAALDVRLRVPMAPEDPNGKIPKLVEQVKDIYGRSTAVKGVQLIFLDLSTPKDKKSKEQLLEEEGIIEYEDPTGVIAQEEHRLEASVYEDIKKKLIRSGIPANEIAFIHEAKTEAKKERLFADANAGTVRVVIGSTEKMGTGTNVQMRLVALHSADCPWRPSDLEQREGRIIRQGNGLWAIRNYLQPTKESPEGVPYDQWDPEIQALMDEPTARRLKDFEIEGYRYSTKAPSFDVYMWQTIESKAKTIAQVMRGDPTMRRIQDVDTMSMTAAEMVAAASDNPLVKEKMMVDDQVRKLSLLKKQATDTAFQAKRELAEIPSTVKKYRKYVTGYEHDIPIRDAHPREPFQVVVQEETYTDREQAGQALNKAVDDAHLHGAEQQFIPVGQYRGFTLFGKGKSRGYFYLEAPGSELRHDGLIHQTGTGTIQAMVYELDHLETRKDSVEQQITDLEKKREKLAKIATGQFDQQAKLDTLLARQQEIIKALDLTAQDAQAAAAAENKPEGTEGTTLKEDDEQRLLTAEEHAEIARLEDNIAQAKAHGEPEIQRQWEQELADYYDKRALPESPDITDEEEGEEGGIASLMRVQGEGGETRAVAGMDPRVMKVLGGNLYSGNLGLIAAKEMLQNAVDSVRGVEGGTISLTVDTETRTFTVEDTGSGMTPDIATKEFGIAKVAIFANAEDIWVTTRAKDPETGQLMETVLTGSGTDWIDPSKGLAVQSKAAPADAGTGTTITIRLMEDTKFDKYALKEWLANFAALSRLPFPVTMTFDGNPLTATDAQAREKLPVSHIFTLDPPGARIEMYASDSAYETTYPKVQVLNKGLPQFAFNVGLQNAVKVPMLIVADVQALADPEAADYPFTPDRQSLRDEAKAAIMKYVDEEMAGGAAKAEIELYRTTMLAAPKIPGTSLKFVDTAGQYDLPILAELAAKPSTTLMGRAIHQAFKALQAVLAARDPIINKVRLAGIGLGDSYLGVNLNWGVVSKDKDADNLILINPYTIFDEVERGKKAGHFRQEDMPEEFARQVVATIVHELSHQQARGHTEQFAGALTRNQGQTIVAAAKVTRRLLAVISRPVPMVQELTPPLITYEGGSHARSGLLDDLTEDTAVFREEWTKRQDIFRKISTSHGEPSEPAGRAGDLAGGPGERAGSEDVVSASRGGPSAPLGPRARLPALGSERGSVPLSTARPSKPLTGVTGGDGRFHSSDPTIDAAVQVAKEGVQTDPLRVRMSRILEEMWHKATREFQFLPDTGEFAPLRTALLQLQKQKPISAARQAYALEDITKGLTPAEYDLLEWKALLSDLAQEVEAKRPIPFYSQRPELVETDLAKVDDLIAQNPKVGERWMRRQSHWLALKTEYIRQMDAIGFDVRKRLTKEDYFRHQILEQHQQARVSALAGTGNRLKAPTGRGFLKTREGSEAAINANYLQAEFEVLAQMDYDIQIGKVLELVASPRYNIHDRLVDEARQKNEARFRTKLAAMEQTDLPEFTRITAEWNHIRQRLGYHFSELRDLLGLDAADPLPFAQIQAIANDAQHEGQGHALGIFKQINARRALIKTTLGKDFLTFDDLIPEGWTLWQAREGNIFFLADSIPAKLARQLQTQLVDSLELTQDQLKKVMAMGGPREQFVIKEEVANTLNALSQPPPSLAVKAWTDLLRVWKAGKLIGPHSFIRYNLRNLTGDGEATLVGNPRAFRKVKEATVLLFPVFAKGAKPEGPVKDWFERGGYASTLQIQEMGDLNDLKLFAATLNRASQRNLLGMPMNLFMKYWHAARLSTDYREAILRFANYLEYLEQMAQHDGRPLNYGASIQETVDALPDQKDKAYKLSNELIGAYDRISVAGQELRKHWYPFWCVPDDTEILTRDGWKRNQNLVIGEEVLTFNVKADAWEWQPVQAVNRFEFDGSLLYAGKFLATENHRWPVLINQGKPQEKIVFRYGADLAFDNQFLQTATHYAEQESILSPRDAALLGWIVTDGYHRWRARVSAGLELMIYQKKPSCLKAIIELAGDEGRAGKPHPITGTVPVRLTMAVSRRLIAAGFWSKADLPKIVTRLSHEAAHAMWQAMMDAEGSIARAHRAFSQLHGPVLEAFQILTHLLGQKCNQGPKKNHYVSHERVIGVKNTRRLVPYSGFVWCPQTPNGTWVMRQGGKIVITGNSWKEVNYTRYKQLTKNAFTDRSASSLAAIAGGLGIRGGVSGLAFALRLGLYWGMLQAWNWLWFPDEERDLNERTRNRPHIIFGRDAQGKVLYLDGIGALGDLLSWVGLDSAASHLLAGDISHDRMTVKELLREMVKAPLNTVVQGLTPAVKVPAEELAGRSYFPDVTRPRPIRDKLQYAVESLTPFGPEYKAAVGKPGKPYFSADAMADLVVQRQDPGYTAYQDWQGIEDKWRSRLGKEPREAYARSPRGEALAQWRLALKYNDQPAILKYRQAFKTAGGDLKNVKASLRALAPLQGLTVQEREYVVSHLEKQDKATLRRAEAFYRTEMLRLLDPASRAELIGSLMSHEGLSDAVLPRSSPPRPLPSLTPLP